MSHANNGKCEKCAEIFDRYPDFHSGLRRWFEEFQAEHPEAHISCAGRGKKDQEACFQNRTSRAHFGQSSHNYGAAIDIFSIQPGKEIYDLDWYNSTLAPAIPSWLNWYGDKTSIFHEEPHVEVRIWKDLVLNGQLKLVEAKDDAA